LLARVGDGHGDALLEHHSTFASRILGILLKVSVTGAGPITLMVACTHERPHKGGRQGFTGPRGGRGEEGLRKWGEADVGGIDMRWENQMS